MLPANRSLQPPAAAAGTPAFPCPAAPDLPTGTFALLHPRLTASGQRADPLNLFEHLERGRVPSSVPALLLILLGLPALLIPAGLSSRPRAREHRLLASALLAACYLLGALPLIPWLWPLLS